MTLSRQDRHRIRDGLVRSMNEACRLGLLDEADALKKLLDLISSSECVILGSENTNNSELKNLLKIGGWYAGGADLVPQ